MSVPIESVHQLDIFFDAGENVPPPFHYAYHLELTLREDKLDAAFDLKYLHREDLTEEEIIEEGFTPDDDWSWKGSLPKLWLLTLKDQLQKSLWPNKPKEAQEGEALLEIQLLNKAGEELFSGRPADVQSWEYFLQEMMQAVFEVAKKEAPLNLHYKEVNHLNQSIEIWVAASFAERQANARQQGMEGPAVKEISWVELKKLLKTVYMPEYDYDSARDEEPKKMGRFLSTGEGLWFTFGESLLEPSANTNSLERLQETFKGLFAK